MARNAFQLEMSPLDIEYSKWGEIGVIPWDSAIFGFPVANFNAGEIEAVRGKTDGFRCSVSNWAKLQNVELIGCHLSAETEEANSWRVILSQCGWTSIEQAARVTLENLQNSTVAPEPFAVEMPLRQAVAEDRGSVVRIAESAFRHGRYSADALFPARLANLRYGRWMNTAFDAAENGDENTRIFVLGPIGDACGFMHLEIDSQSADIRLNAIDISRAPRGSGRCLYEQTLQILRKHGVRQVTAKISLSNMPVVNLYAKRGFRFSQPEWVFHWHAPHAPHLLNDR